MNKSSTLKLIIFIFCILGYILSYGQSTALDSIDLLIENAKTIDNKTLWKAIKQSYDEEPKRVKKYADLLLQKKDIQRDSSLIMKVLNFEALADRKLGFFPASINNFEKIYQYQKIHQDSVSLAAAADQIGTMKTFLGNMKSAQPYVLEAYLIYKALGLKTQIASSTNGLAIFYNDLGNRSKAIEKYDEALILYKALNDTLGQANVHANLGLSYIEEKRYKKAEYHLLMQGKLDTLLGTKWGLGFHHDFMGYLMRKQGKHEEALLSHHKSLTIRLNLDSHYNIAESRAGLSEAYFDLGNYKESIIQANFILDKKEKHQSLSQEQNAYRLLSKAYEALSKFNKSLEYYKKYKSTADSIYNRNLLEEITEKDAIYEKSISDSEIQLLNEKNRAHKRLLGIQRNIMIAVSIGFVILSLLLFFLFKLYNSLKKNKEKLVKTLGEKNILLREIHHRVKNNLQLISSLLTLQGRSIDDETALKAINDGRNRVRSMALIHQDLYNKENLTVISIKDYLEKLCRELFDTYKIDKNTIILKLNIEDLDIDIDTVVPLGLIINELITNSLKYAFTDGRKGILKIDLQKQGENLELTVNDNGIGYDQSKVRKESFGSTLVSALTNQLDGVMKVESKNGTQTQLSFKL